MDTFFYDQVDFILSTSILFREMLLIYFRGRGGLFHCLDWGFVWRPTNEGPLRLDFMIHLGLCVSARLYMAGELLEALNKLHSNVRGFFHDAVWLARH